MIRHKVRRAPLNPLGENELVSWTYQTTCWPSWVSEAVWTRCGCGAALATLAPTANARHTTTTAVAAKRRLTALGADDPPLVRADADRPSAIGRDLDAEPQLAVIHYLL